MLPSNLPPRVYLSPVHNTFHFIQGFPWFLFKLPSTLLPRIYLSPVHVIFQFSPKGLPESCSCCLLIFPPGFTWVLFIIPSTLSKGLPDSCSSYLPIFPQGFTWVLFILPSNFPPRVYLSPVHVTFHFTRVYLSPGSEHDGADYINASWLTGKLNTLLWSVE